MKIKSLFLAVAFVLTSIVTLNAQDRQNPWTIEIGTNAVDFYPVGLESGQILDGVGRGRPFVHGALSMNTSTSVTTIISCRRPLVWLLGVTYSVGSA